MHLEFNDYTSKHSLFSQEESCTENFSKNCEGVSDNGPYGVCVILSSLTLPKHAPAFHDQRQSKLFVAKQSVHHSATVRNIHEVPTHGMP